MNLETYRLQLGRFACVAIMDDASRYPIGMFLTNLPKDTYAPLLLERGQDPEQIDLPYTCLFVDTGRERVLIDTGTGAQSGSPTSGKLLQHLRAQGIEPHQIDMVILSHGHGDHVGGCLNANGNPAFANARYVMFREEWDFWMSNPTLDELPVDEGFKKKMLMSAQKNLRGVQRQLDLVHPNVELVPGITAVEAFGHSPGQMALEISSADERLLFVADAVVHPLHLEYPETIGVTDHRPDEVVATRIELLDKAARERTLVATSHFAFPGIGRVLPKGRRWEWQPIGFGASVC